MKSKIYRDGCYSSANALENPSAPLPSNYLFTECPFCYSVGENPRIQTSNMTRKCIRDFFPKRKCFVFHRPTNDNSLLAHIQEVSEDELESAFKSQSEQFCSYISTHGKVKTLGSGVTVTGKREFL